MITRGINPLIIIKTKAADQTVNNTATLVDCADLALKVGANSMWLIMAYLDNVSTSSADIDIAYSGPTGATAVRCFTENLIAGLGLTTENQVAGKGTNALQCEMGIFTIGATPGTLQLKFAQSSAEVSDAKILSGSCLICTRIK